MKAISQLQIYRIMDALRPFEERETHCFKIYVSYRSENIYTASLFQNFSTKLM